MNFKKILLLPHLRIHNANALSSPFTIGFPAMTAWLGATHALQRKLKNIGVNLIFKSTAVVNHQFELQTYRGENDYVSSIIGAGNPLDKFGKRSSFIEEARCHLDVSLLIEVEGISQEQEICFLDQVTHLLNTNMKIASGDIQSFKTLSIHVLEENNIADLIKLTRKIMPGYVLVERRDLMMEAMRQGQDAMDAMLDYLAIHHSCTQNDDGVISWQAHRKSQKDKPAGWIIPIATGFQGISDLGQAKNQRDPSVLHCFAESLVTLGEFKMPHRFHSIDEMLWCYHVDMQNNLYQCIPITNNNQFNEYI